MPFSGSVYCRQQALPWLTLRSWRGRSSETPVNSYQTTWVHLHNHNREILICNLWGGGRSLRYAVQNYVYWKSRYLAVFYNNYYSENPKEDVTRARHVTFLFPASKKNKKWQGISNSKCWEVLIRVLLYWSHNILCYMVKYRSHRTP
jgi:hypothetical protein